MNRLAAVVVALFSGAVLADDVNGYERKDGTYVQPYERTHRNETRNDNYSTEGNYNPNTGKEGTKPRDDGYKPDDGFKPEHHRRQGRSYGGTGYHHVRGYTKKSGTYVAPHYAKNPSRQKP